MGWIWGAIINVNIFNTYNFLGDEDRTYYVDLTGNGAAGKGKPTTKPDATLTMEADKIEELFDGQ